MILLYQFVCPSAKELEQTTMDDFIVQAVRDAMFVGVVDVDATPKLGEEQIDICVFNEPTLLNIPKGGFMLADSEGGIIIFPFVCTIHGIYSYSNGQKISFSIRSVKFKGKPTRVKRITLDEPQFKENIEVE